ncbi:MAG: phage shock protein operon transcriptional activator [Deltaproteobacteria bacterium]|nr:phage shock protein operon transcriptional activator [Deltaproteobacteria bacterium]
MKMPEALGQSEKFLVFQERLARVAPINRPVLLLGERGTGKELAAARLHYLSSRWDGPMIALNCSALNPSLIESELFGYERGAFTGADQRRTGRFENADNGSIFLDEIGTIPLEVQEKILRVVEYGTFERVGSSESIEVDVRIIAATNADLVMLASKGLFKQDLMDRLSFEVLFLPPLRERKEDIMLLAKYFAGRMSFELKRDEIPFFSSDAVKVLENYSWPGNVRELKNLVERAVYRSDSTEISDSDIIFDPFQSPYNVISFREKDDLSEGPVMLKNLLEPEQRSFHEMVDAFKKGLVEDALKDARYNQRLAAKLLGLTYHQFRGLYRKYRMG